MDWNKIQNDVLTFNQSLKKEILQRSCKYNKNTQFLVESFLNKRNDFTLAFLISHLKGDDDLIELVYLYEDSREMFCAHIMRTRSI